MATHQIKVYYDGLCVICSAEINHYRKMQGSDKINFIDITRPDFDPVKEGLNPKLVHKELHAKDRNEVLHIGVDAFILIWSNLNKLNWLAKAAKSKIINSFLKANYSLFVKIRPYLPRKNCETSPYCETRSAP